MKTTTLSLETAKLMCQSSDLAIKQFALDNYPELGIKQLPKTWEELELVKGYYNVVRSEIGTTLSDGNPTITINKNVFVTKEQAEASIALAQLSQLKKVYNGDWEADWKNNNQDKYTLNFKSNILIKDSWSNYHQFLSFKTSKLRDEFLTNFKDLIEQAKPLL